MIHAVPEGRGIMADAIATRSSRGHRTLVCPTRKKAIGRSSTTPSSSDARSMIVSDVCRNCSRGTLKDSN